MVDEKARPWGVHVVRDIFAPQDSCAAGLPGGRWVTAVCEPSHGNRLRAAWWVLTGRAFALVWPKPGDLEAALQPKELQQ